MIANPLCDNDDDDDEEEDDDEFNYVVHATRTMRKCRMAISREVPSDVRFIIRMLTFWST